MGWQYYETQFKKKERFRSMGKMIMNTEEMFINEEMFTDAEEKVDALYEYLNNRRIEHSSICKLIEMYTTRLNAIEKEFGKVNSSFALPVDTKEVSSWSRDMISTDYGSARSNARKYHTLLSLAISRKIILEDEMELLALEVPKAYEALEAPLLNEKELNDIFADSGIEENKHKEEVGV